SGGKRTLIQPLFQSFAFQVLHYQIVDSVLATDVVQCANVGMGQTGKSAGFTLKTLAGLGTRVSAGSKDLNCNRALQARVSCAVNLAHTTGSQRCLDFIWAEPSSGSESHERWDQKLSFSPNCRLRGLAVLPAFPN